MGISDFIDTSSIIRKSLILKLKALSLNAFYKSFMGTEGRLWTISEITGRSILYEIFGPLTLDFDFSSFKKMMPLNVLRALWENQLQ